MARSLFDELRAAKATPAATPKLKPNIFAKITRFAWQHATLVILLWLLVALASGFVAWRNYAAPISASLPLATEVVSNQAAASGFAALAGQQTITLTGPKPELLADQRDDLVAALHQRDDVYQLVFSPGAGDYYEANGLLYHPVDEVQGRVAYALSLKPLFNAIATAPNANSMTTLVNEISAAIDQGRDPQGLDDLLSESAQSVQALMRGEDRPVDWAKLADLEDDNISKTVTILAVPRAGQEAAARARTSKLLSVLQNTSDTTTNLAQAGVPPPKRSAAPIDNLRALAAGAIGAIFGALLLALSLGRLRLIFVVFSPLVIFLPMLAAALLLRVRGDWLAYWPIAVCLGWLCVTLCMHAVFAKVTYANGRKSRESLIMLADHHHGLDLVWLWLVQVLPFAAAVAFMSGYGLAATFAGLAVAVLLMAKTLPSALLRYMPEALLWRAGEWLTPAHRALFETGQWQWLARGLGALLVASSVAFLVLAPPHLDVHPNDAPVSVLARDAADGEILIKRLQAFKEAKAVRWLGMFLPHDVAPKLAALAQLGGQFPRITPVLSERPSDIRDQLETLQDSLKQIAASEQAKPRLKLAADEFRRSLALLAATSGDEQVRQLENRLFGGFNRLADRADTLSSLTAPQLATLPEELHTLFGTPEGTMRIEVLPAEGVSNASLAEILDTAGLNVMHSSIEQEQEDRAASSLVRSALALAAMLGLALTLISIPRVKSGALAIAMAAAAALVAMAIARSWQLEWNLTNLLQLLAALSALFAFVWPAARHGASTTTQALELFLMPTMALALVLPFSALGVTQIANALVPLAGVLAATALIVGLLRQHRALPDSEF